MTSHKPEQPPVTTTTNTNQLTTVIPSNDPALEAAFEDVSDPLMDRTVSMKMQEATLVVD